MPRGDGTGPMGMGPLTGRGMGYCIGAGYPGNARGGRGFFGRGFGMGREMGRGFFGGTAPVFGGGFPAPVSVEQEKSVLENQVLAMEQNLAELKKRLSEMA